MVPRAPPPGSFPPGALIFYAPVPAAPPAPAPRAPDRPPPCAVYLDAGRDRNGNPRRGWIVYLSGDDTPAGFVDEGHLGAAALRQAYPDAVSTERVPVAPRVYRTAKAHRA